MARPAKIEYEGAFYHVMNRGNRGEDIFLDTRDREIFHEILGYIENRYGDIVYVFVLMSNITISFRIKPIYSFESIQN